MSRWLWRCIRPPWQRRNALVCPTLKAKLTARCPQGRKRNRDKTCKVNKNIMTSIPVFFENIVILHFIKFKKISIFLCSNISMRILMFKELLRHIEQRVFHKNNSYTSTCKCMNAKWPKISYPWRSKPNNLRNSVRN